MKLKFSLIQDIKDFVNIANKYALDITLRSKGYIVDGKSLLGILSLDLSNPVEVEASKEEGYDNFIEDIKRFAV